MIARTSGVDSNLKGGTGENVVIIVDERELQIPPMTRGVTLRNIVHVTKGFPLHGVASHDAGLNHNKLLRVETWRGSSKRGRDLDE